MRRLRLTPMAMLGATILAAAGCGDDATGVSVADLVGTWDAVDWELVSLANSAVKAYPLTEGYSLTMTIEADGDCTTTLDHPQYGSFSSSVTVSVSGGNLTFTDPNPPAPPDGEPGPYSFTYSFELSGGTLTLETGDAEWDFGDGYEAASEVIVLEKT